jgi:hypothetical protein
MAFDNQTWGSISDIVTAVAAVVGVAGLWFARREIRVATEELRTEHERYKEKNALEATAAYANWGPQELRFARELVEELDQANCKKIEEGQSILIPEELLQAAAGCLNGIVAEAELSGPDRRQIIGKNNYIELNKREVIHIRWLAVSQLSQLEIALLAWYYKAARPVIIEDQFAEHICPSGDKKKPALHEYRAATDGDRYYPALTHFIEVTLARRKKTPPPSQSEPNI